MQYLRHLRAVGIAFVAVIFSATIALAGQPSSHAAAGLAKASAHAGQTVPVQATDQGSQDETTGDESTDTDTDESDSSDNCTVDLTGDVSGLNHGQVVCTAAQMDTPDGYANHGAWVSHWAKMNKGADAAAAGKAHKPSH